MVITISVAHHVDRGIEVGYFAFVTYEGGAVNPPSNRIFSVSRTTTPSHRRGLNPQEALDKLALVAIKKARRRGINHVYGLDN